jgi:medium-chain acyl-[acyl-carrier-protein] hydrolase
MTAGSVPAPTVFQAAAGEDTLLDLHCLAFAGGSVQSFRPWGATLPAAVALTGLELPGRGLRADDPPAPGLSCLLDELVDRIAAAPPRPMALFGHSMGALIAFELARRLTQGSPRESRTGPVALFVCGHAAPHLAATRRSGLHALDDAALVRQLRAWGGTPPDLLDDPALLQRILPPLRADLEICETYALEGGAPLDIPIFAYAGEADETEPVDAVRAWGDHTRAAFRFTSFPGGHFFFFESARDAFLRQLASDLRLVCSMLLAERTAPRKPTGNTPAQASAQTSAQALKAGVA